MSARKLLVISGPIASGKSTLSHVLAAELRANRRRVAVVDLDRVYMMLEDRSPMDDRNIWREARKAAAALTDQFVLDGIDLVIVEGTFWTQSERDEFASRLTTVVDPIFVTLQVTPEEALRRVEGDTGRRASRIPELLRASHTEFTAAPTIPGDLTIDSTGRAVEEVASLIRHALELSAASNGPAAPLFKDVDCVQIPVPNLDAGLAFYRDALDHALIWRTVTAAGLSMADSASELVIQTERPELEPNLSVASADAAAQRFVDAGGGLLVPPFDIAIGRCAVVRDPWGNRLVLLDHTRGRLLTDARRSVRLNADGSLQTQAHP